MPAYLRRAAVLLASGVIVAAPALAQERGTLRILVGFPPGTALDSTARLLGERLRASLGQTPVVENRPGVAGQLATEQLKSFPPDGNTILVTPLAPVVTHPHVYPKLRYDPFRDIAPVAHVANFEFAFAVPAPLELRTLADYVALVKRDVKFGNYSSAGAGAIPHFFGVLFGRTAGIEIVHVPYKGTAQALPDLVSGQIAGFVGTIGDVLPLHRAAKARVLATSGKARHRSTPDIPTFREQGIDIEGFGWYAVYAPGGTPPAAIERLSGAIIAALRDPQVAAKLDALGMDLTGLGPAALAAIQKADFDKWGPIIRASGFKAE